MSGNFLTIRDFCPPWLKENARFPNGCERTFTGFLCGRFAFFFLEHTGGFRRVAHVGFPIRAFRGDSVFSVRRTTNRGFSQKNREIFPLPHRFRFLSNPMATTAGGSGRSRLHGNGSPNAVGKDTLCGCSSVPFVACRGDIASRTCRRTGGAGRRNREARGLVPTCRGIISPAGGRGGAPRPSLSLLFFSVCCYPPR